MSKIKVSKSIDSTFGNMVNISNGIVNLSASLDFGPRIMNYSLTGMDNMFYNDNSMSPINNVLFPEFDGGILKVYGGHRLWISPEIMPRCYYPDNLPVDLKETEEGIVLTAPAEKINNIQKSIELKLNEYNGEVIVVHTIKNVGAWNIVFAPWALTVMDKGGVEVVPQADAETGLLSNRFVGLWPYAKMNDERVYWGDKYIVLRQDPSIDRSFKFGTNNEKGWAAYFNKGQLFVKQYVHEPEGFYPDFAGCSFETFTNNQMVEIETLGHTGVVEPQQAVTHEEKWTLYKEDFMPDKDEEKITQVISRYI